VGLPQPDTTDHELGDGVDSAEGDETVTAAGTVLEDNSLGRLLALSDGVFAIAMTLLALDLRVPDLGDPATDAQLRHALVLEAPSFLTFLVSFYVVASYWVFHRLLMRSVTATHPRLMVHTLPLLLLVAALPFPSSLLARYGSEPTALVVYGVVNVAASLLLLWLRHDIEAYGLSTGSADQGAWFRYGWALWGNVAVFALCIPAGYVLGGKAPFVLLLLLLSGDRSSALWLRWRRRSTRRGHK
jgi:uncharacterized membrane protein